MAGPVLPETIDLALSDSGCALPAGWPSEPCAGGIRLDQVAMLGSAIPGGGSWLGRAMPVVRAPRLPDVAPVPAPAPHAVDPPRASVFRGLSLAVARVMAHKRQSLLALRPLPWRRAPDSVIPPRDFPRMADFAGIGNRLQPAVPWLAGAPGGAVRLRPTQGIDGMRLSDFAFLPALAQRVLMTRFYPGELADVRLWWGSVLVPLQAGPVLRPILPLPLSPFPRQPGGGAPAAVGPNPLPALSPIAPVPLAPGGLFLVAAIGAVIALRRTTARR